MTTAIVVVCFGLLAAFLIDAYLKRSVDHWRDDEEQD